MSSRITILLFWYGIPRSTAAGKEIPMSYRIAGNIGGLKIWRFTPRPSIKNINLVVALRSVILHHGRVYQGALPSSHVRYFNKAVSSQIYQKYKWQHASAELATCTAHVKGCQEHCCMDYVITCCGRKCYWRILIWRFQAQPPNRQI